MLTHSTIHEEDDHIEVVKVPDTKPIPRRKPSVISFLPTNGAVAMNNAIQPKPPAIGRSSTQKFARRASNVFGAAGRGQPEQLPFDEETIKIFFKTHGLSVSDLDIGFNFISKDKRKIYPDDVKRFMTEYFEDLPDEAYKLLEDWKEPVTKEQMANMLLNRTNLSAPYEELWKWMRPSEDGKLHHKQLNALAGKVNSLKKPRKHDVWAILKRYDRDQDGYIGLSDFKRMSL
ncbi:hypothetical protein BC833DRAFT_602305 [Globomyces pollinis-pini]|nr:hypothetical protein BC833DRAFT_602305 [Globomyces pollinis-pini]